VEPGLVIVVIAVAGLLPLGWIWSPKRRAALLRTFSAKHQLVLAPESRADAERLLVAQRRGQTLGAVVALVATEALLLAGPRSWEGSPLGTFSIVLVLGPALWLSTLAGGIAASLAARPGPNAPRVAHLPEPSLADYVPTLLRWWGPAALAVAAVVTAVYVASPPAGPGWVGRNGALVGLGLAGLALLVAELTMRWVLHAPEPAADASLLEVRDLVKGETLGELATAFVPSLLAAVLLVERFPVLGWPALAAVLVPLVLQRDVRRHLHDRLWPAPP
jgi:hypothetical protein